MRSEARKHLDFMKHGARLDHGWGVATLEDHLAVMAAGEMGAALLAFQKAKAIPIVENNSISEYARYIRHANGKEAVEYSEGPYFSARVLGHEIRHAQQFHILKGALTRPENPHERVVFDRFIEADARAVDLGLAFEIISRLSPKHRYAERLLDNMEGSFRPIYKGDIMEIFSIAGRPERLNQAMRRAFNSWILRAPIQQTYEAKTRDGLREKFEKKRLAPRHAEMDPDYPRKLAQALGDIPIGTKGNYLIDTDGPAWDSEIYRRIVNHQTEKLVSDIRAGRKPD